MIEKITYISTASNISGATLALLEIIDEVRKRGTEVSVVTAARGPLETHLEERGVKVYKARYFSWLYTEKELGSLSGKLKMAIKNALEHHAENYVSKVLSKEKPNAVHLNTGISPVGLKSAHELNIPVLWHLRELPEEYWARRPRDKDYEIQCLREADALVAISKYVEERYSNKSPNNIKVIYDGVDTDGFWNLRTKAPFSNNKIRLSLCGYSEFKGHIEAITALSMLSTTDYHSFELSLWGRFQSGEYKRKLEQLASSLGVSDSVVFKGYTDNMPQEWANTDIALMCSHCEAFGRVTVEAMAAGALVIGADAGATTELLSDGCGMLYKSEDAASLANAINSAVSDIAASRSIAARGQRYVMSGAYSVKKSVSALFELYEKFDNSVDL